MKFVAKKSVRDDEKYGTKMAELFFFFSVIYKVFVSVQK